ncbi:MAG: hypothetical protein AUK44_06155 [Porphyromonadaceae bacterium CG2_30_38_12]|nr:MAG: hypothetical protein AUK44_06155 [Porphyromonadaceae bacterium CG2_30_38_12]
MYKYFIFAFVLVTFSILMQACGSMAQLKKADKKFEMGAYNTAGNLYKRAYSRTSGKEKALRARISYNMGECNRILNFPNAEANYANAIRYEYPDSIVLLRYAQVLQRNGKYNEAIRNYKLYLTKDSGNVFAQNGLKCADFVASMKKQPTAYLVKPYDLFNVRRNHNFSPSYQNTDGDVLFFTSDRMLNKKGQQKNTEITGLPANAIYSSRKNAAGKWEKPAPVFTEVKTVVSEDGVTNFSPDGNTMYFTRSRQQFNSDSGTEIFVSQRAGGAWSDAKKLSIFKDSTISVAHPTISPDGQTLVFVSDKKDGFGAKDLWTAQISGSECTAIHNMGPQFNTDGDEMFPSFRWDGSLYFASNGLPGLGGLDIFKATPTKGDGWHIENMGMPINSNFDDFGICFEGKAEKGFFSTNRKEARGYDMIWSFEIPVFEYLVKGKVLDEKNNPIPDALVRLVSNTGINTKVQTKKDGSYRVKIDKELSCVMLATARGYLNKGASINSLGATKSKTIIQNFSLQTIFKPIQLENIFYEFGKWDLTPASEVGLQALIKVLTDNPNITIEISAHTDYIGNNEANKTLSAKRAQAVVDYLIRAGIASQRLSSVGYGEEKPYVVDTATAEQFSYLKENDVLTEDNILKLTPEQQEQANQINRRTEFRVLKTSYK